MPWKDRLPKLPLLLPPLQPLVHLEWRCTLSSSAFIFPHYQCLAPASLLPPPSLH